MDVVGSVCAPHTQASMATKLTDIHSPLCSPDSIFHMPIYDNLDIHITYIFNIYSTYFAFDYAIDADGQELRVKKRGRKKKVLYMVIYASINGHYYI